MQMKAIEQYLHFILFIVLYNCKLALKIISNIQACGWNPYVWSTIQMKAVEDYFHVALYNFAAQGGSNF